MSRIVDYTKMRRNSIIAGCYIGVCPKCGKRGLRFVLPEKTIYMHTGEKTLKGIEMTDNCEVAREAVEAL